MGKSRSRHKRALYRPKPGDELTIEQLESIARYLGYSLVCIRGYSPDLYDCRTGCIEKRGDDALDHLRSIYVDRGGEIPGM